MACTWLTQQICKIISKKFLNHYSQQFRTFKNLVLYSMFVWGGEVNTNVYICSLMIPPACTCMASSMFKWSACIYAEAQSTSNIWSLMVAQKSTDKIAFAFEALAALLNHFNFVCWGKVNIKCMFTNDSCSKPQYCNIHVCTTSNMFKWIWSLTLMIVSAYEYWCFLLREWEIQ